jgi:transketolase
MRKVFINKLFEAAKKNRNIVLISGDLGFSVVEEFAQTLPGQFINAGIAEQNMTGVAAGLAMAGKKVFTYSIANFPTLRCLEQVRNDVCYHDVDVTVVSVGAGFAYGSQGYTHHGLEDAAILRTLPNMKICVPSDEDETERSVDLILNTKGPFYLKLDKGKVNAGSDQPEEFGLGRVRVLLPGQHVLIAAQGSIASEAMEAANTLEKMGISAEVWSVPWLKPLDEEAITDAGKRFSLIVTVEEAQKFGGLGSAFSEVIASSPEKTARVLIKAVPDTILHRAYSQQAARKLLNLDASSIAKEIAVILG